MRTRVWLIHLINDRTRSKAAPTPPPPNFEAWLHQECGHRGYGSGRPVFLANQDSSNIGEIPRDDLPAVNHVAHQIDLAYRVLLAHGSYPADRVSPLLLSTVAFAHGAEAPALRLLRSALSGQVSAGLVNDLAATVGDRILRRSITPSSQNFELPFHHLRLLSELRLAARIANVMGGLPFGGDHGEVDLRALDQAQGVSRAILYRALSASIALVAADGSLDRSDNRVIALLFQLAGLDRTETAMLETELRDPASVDELAREMSCPFEGRFLLQHLLIVGYLNGRLDESERGFIEELSNGMGIGEPEYRRLETGALEVLKRQELRLAQHGHEAIWEKVRKQMVFRVEKVVRKNAKGIWREVCETGELLAILTRASRGPLPAEEKEKMRRQLLDVAKTIPALAIFAAPGGGLLLPLLIKHLPIDLRPSNFIDEASFDSSPSPTKPS